MCSTGKKLLTFRENVWRTSRFVFYIQWCKFLWDEDWWPFIVCEMWITSYSSKVVYKTITQTCLKFYRYVNTAESSQTLVLYKYARVHKIYFKAILINLHNGHAHNFTCAHRCKVWRIIFWTVGRVSSSLYYLNNVSMCQLTIQSFQRLIVNQVIFRIS